jgi:hypothetical protein
MNNEKEPPGLSLGAGKIQPLFHLSSPATSGEFDLVLDIYNPKIVITGTLKKIRLLKEENTSIAMNTNSFPQIINFIGV